jgi:hypothetical protein
MGHCFNLRRAGWTSGLLILLMSSQRAYGQPTNTDPMSQFGATLSELATEPPRDCNADGLPSNAVGSTEQRLFKNADDILLKARSGTNNPPAAAVSALQNLRDLSAKIQANWPQENRFHYEVHNWSSLIVEVFDTQPSDFFCFWCAPVGRAGKEFRMETRWNRRRTMWRP